MKIVREDFKNEEKKLKKYFNDEYYSFNLSKKGGVIRLIFKIDTVNNVVILKFISMNHYANFKRKKGIMG